MAEPITLVTSAIAHCRDRRVTKLLIDVTGLVGVAIPSLIDRFLMVEEWAQEGRGVVAAAMVARPEYIHPRKFGVRVAADFGMVAEVFTSGADALQWLSSNPELGKGMARRVDG